MMDLLRRSNIEIHKVLFGELPKNYNPDRITTLILTTASIQIDLSPTNSLSGPNPDMSVVKVAMLSITFQNWSKLCIMYGMSCLTLL